MRFAATLYGKPLWAEVTVLDNGLDVGVFGGDVTHVGAVTLAQPDGSFRTLQRFQHRDSAISRHWAVTLAAARSCPVCVRAGIHLDGFSKQMLPQIFAACDDLLHSVLGADFSKA